ncbi:unnamed protein product [Sphagnum troendelagicum]|uniref:Secreted protein n=1 Tax=Sphagnum troendelagicum TaxID=128251 RepID=A0ABP0TDY1_9BRYO
MKFCKPLATFLLLLSHRSQSLFQRKSKQRVQQKPFFRDGFSGLGHQEGFLGRHGTGCFAQFGEQQALLKVFVDYYCNVHPLEAVKR